MSSCAEDKSWRLPLASFLTLTLSLTCFYLRLTFRPRSPRPPHRRQYFLEDVLLSISLLICLIMAVSTIFAAKKGLGKHSQCIPPDGIVYFLKALLAWEYLYTGSLALTKLSLLSMFKRLFDVHAFAPAFWTLFALIAAWALGSILAVSLICIPFSAAWSNPMQCHSWQALYWGIAVPNILTDAALLSVPIWYIKDIRLDRTQKLGLYMSFSCGGLVFVVSIIRLAVLVNTPFGADITWVAVSCSTWSLVECNIAIVSACVPTLRPFLKEIQQRCYNLTRSLTTERLKSQSSATTEDLREKRDDNESTRNCAQDGLKLVLSFRSTWMQSVEEEINRRIGRGLS